MNIYLRKIYILFVTQTFSVKIIFVQKYISEMRYISFIFSFIFFFVKEVFYTKKFSL